MSTYSPQTLGWWMDERRGELALTWQQVADAAGVSTETLYRAADGRPLRTKTRKGIERALRWRSGSIDSILGGGEPQPLPTTDESVEVKPAVRSGRPRIDPASASWGDIQRELKHFNLLLKDADEFDRLMDLLDLYAQAQANRRTPPKST